MLPRHRDPIVAPPIMLPFRLPLSSGASSPGPRAPDQGYTIPQRGGIEQAYSGPARIHSANSQEAQGTEGRRAAGEMRKAERETGAGRNTPPAPAQKSASCASG